ncbi:hypothetical protein JVT61DRAFT_15336 [Boletus reticuloceps]|uniref:RING-type domain-containing protein n=1 Tax=Boletus reticuloceps TaxID=495285 RepID=A0A8I3ACI5_9AGAM|nr:hypothetical protein JVT61DRAFT_15336 [Boletus reticuloceps]
MPSVSTWYNNQYSTWNRTRRLQVSPFLARTDTRASRTATAMAHNGAVLVNMAPADNANKKESKQLFGPDIGVVNNVPAWAHPVGKNSAADSLSADIIKNWIAKSKESSQPTTTLQALVNLKRPTLRLVPLAMAPGDDPDQADSHHHHGLEFEFDCDAPKCKIDVNVTLPADHPLAETVDSRGFSRILVFQSVVDGGFGKFLKLEQDATLELGRFEQSARPENPPAEIPPADAQATTTAAPSPRNGRSRKRFTAFHFHKRSGDRAASGPALAVVDADAANTSPESEKDKAVKDDMWEGVRATIRLSALHEDGMDLPTINEQTTYLHIVRVGTPPAADEEDIRPWVVKVIKREAMVSVHYPSVAGYLTQSCRLARTHSISTRSMVLPPRHLPLLLRPLLPRAQMLIHTRLLPTSAAPSAIHEDEPSSECLLCLSSPREVILLPCRHLVACRECAINMVEFGAGGNITHNEATNGTGTDATAGEGSGAANTSATEGTNPPTVTPPNPRRKRKAKGWFCPVCRQRQYLFLHITNSYSTCFISPSAAYTSLLRVSTTPPTKDISDDENRGSTSMDDPENEQEGTEGNDATELVLASNDPLSTAPGSMINTLRSGFRNLALGSNSTRPENETLPRDVERGLGSEAIAA